MKIVGHADVQSLEQTLLRTLDREHPTDGSGRSLVLVPTRRMATHLQRRLVAGGSRPAWLGVEFLTYHALALAILERARVRPPRVLSARVREAWVRQLLEEFGDNRWARFVDRRPGALGRLLQTIEDLREGGVLPTELSQSAGESRWDRDLVEIYSLYSGRLEQLTERGWTDEAGFITRAVPHGPAYAAEWTQILVYGVYEWLGVHLELMAGLERARELTLLLPATPGAEISRYAEAFAARHLETPIEPVDDSAGAGPLALLDLYEEQRRPAPAAPGRLALRQVQGSNAEVETAVLSALDAIADGSPPAEILIVARTLAPYGAALESSLEDRGLNWTSSLTFPLRRHPFVRDLLLLIQCIADDFPRRAVVELLRSPRLRWTAIPGVDEAPPGDLADRFSRHAGIVSGLEEWTEVLPAWAGDPQHRGSPERRRQAEQIAGCLRAVDDYLPSARATWSRHAANVGTAIEELLPQPPNGPDARAIARLREVVGEMEQLESVLGRAERVPFRQVRQWIDETCGKDQIAARRTDSGGIRVLDAMQSRGLTHDRVFLLGMNSGVFPRAGREDPVLGDAVRCQLRERFRRPLTVSSEAGEEERLLLALMLGGARQRIDVSWQRADEGGRARSPSLALREVLRLATGKPDLAALTGKDVVSVPTHPSQWLTYLAGDVGILSPSHAMLLAMLTGSGDDHLDRMTRRYPELTDGLRMLKATQGFTISAPEYDGRPQTTRALEKLSVSQFEMLGYCPMRYFFRHVLAARELDAETTAATLPLNQIGTLAHDALQRLYGSLVSGGRFERGSPEEMRQAAREWLETERERLFGDIGQRLARRLPLLWRITLDGWVGALALFVDLDLDRVVKGGWTPDGLEQPIAGTVELDDDRHVQVFGRMDRRLTSDDALLVSDYKTSGDLSKRVDVKSMLRGLALQVPLYQLLAGDGSQVELLGVGPGYDPRGEETARVCFGGFGSTEELAGFRETLRILLELARAGRFPLRVGTHCAWCAYRSACRRTHPPTLHRETQYEDGRRYDALLKKTRKRPLLGNPKDDA